MEWVAIHILPKDCLLKGAVQHFVDAAQRGGRQLLSALLVVRRDILGSSSIRLYNAATVRGDNSDNRILPMQGRM